MPSLRPGQSVVGDTAANWTGINPILQRSIIGVEHDTGKGKVGDGVTAWNDLEYSIKQTANNLVTSATGTMTIYVDPAATGNNDGTSWTDAYTSLQTAIDSIPFVILDGSVSVYLAEGEYSGVDIYKLGTYMGESGNSASISIYGSGGNGACNTNATIGRVATYGAVPGGIKAGQTLVAWNKSTHEWFEAEVTEVGSGYIQTDEVALTPTTDWIYVCTGTVFTDNIQLNCPSANLFYIRFESGRLTTWGLSDSISVHGCICYDGSLDFYNVKDIFVTGCFFDGYSYSYIDTCGYGYISSCYLNKSTLSFTSSSIKLSTMGGTSDGGALVECNEDVYLRLYNVYFTGYSGIEVYGSTRIRGTNVTNACTYTVYVYDDYSLMVDSGVPSLSSGTAAPSSTPTKVGDIFIDTTNKVSYVAVGAASTDWIGLSEVGHNHDAEYLAIDGTADNAALLDGHDSTYFSPATHDHDSAYLAIGGTATDSLLLEGASAAEFATADHMHDMDDITVSTTIRLRPQVEFGRIQATSKPTIVSRGVVQGYSLPVYNSDEEELYITQSVPRRWDEASNITFGCMAMLDTANTDKKFKLAIEWQQVTAGDVVGTATVTASHEISVTGAASQYMTYDVSMTIDYDYNTPDVIEANDVLAIRLRRVAASADEITGEVVVYGFYIQYDRDKIGP